MTFLTRKTLTRRTMLKGMGVSVALPLLDSMIPPLAAPIEAGAHAAGVCLRGARRHPFGVETAADRPPVRVAAQPAAARRPAGSLQHLHESLAPGSRQQGRRQRRSQPRRRGLAHRRACLRPHAPGRRDPPRRVGRPDRRQAPGQGQPRALHRDDARPGDAGGMRFWRLLLREHRLVAQRDLAQHARDPPARDLRAPVRRRRQRRAAARPHREGGQPARFGAGGNTFADREARPLGHLQAARYLDSVREVEQRIQNAESSLEESVELPDRPIGIPASFEEYASSCSTCS